MSVESIEKLRTAARNMSKGMNLEEHEECNLLLVIADEIEREVAEQQKRWAQQAMKCANDSAKLKLVELAHENTELKREIAELKREIKPRTVEDVLNDFASEAYDVDGRDDEEWLPLLAKYAAELQMRGGAE